MVTMVIIGQNKTPTDKDAILFIVVKLDSRNFKTRSILHYASLLLNPLKINKPQR